MAPSFHEKSENTHPKICWFFHETQWLFEVFEINGTGLYSDFFQIPETGDFFTLNFSNMQNWRFLNSDFFFKYLEKAIINKIKEPPNTGVYKCSMEIKSESAGTIMKG
jgi:hypothetical protein